MNWLPKNNELFPYLMAVHAMFDLFASKDFDINMCMGYPSMRARFESYQGTGYAVEEQDQ
jgi:hypothetical protein